MTEVERCGKTPTIVLDVSWQLLGVTVELDHEQSASDTFPVVHVFWLLETWHYMLNSDNMKQFHCMAATFFETAMKE